MRFVGRKNTDIEEYMGCFIYNDVIMYLYDFFLRGERCTDLFVYNNDDEKGYKKTLEDDVAISFLVERGPSLDEGKQYGSY